MLILAVRWVPGGHSTMLGILNSIVHGFMYSYYFATAFRPELKKSLWWKKYITQIQLVIILTISTYSNIINIVLYSKI